MHDIAVTIWGIKGYYDFIRPISAIRYMSGKGQSSDASKPSYDPRGIPLEKIWIKSTIRQLVHILIICVMHF